MKRTQYFKWGLTAFLTVCAVLVFYDTFYQAGTLQQFVSKLASILAPVLYGFAIAYLLTPIMSCLERAIAALWKKLFKKELKQPSGALRLVSILLTEAVVIFLLYLLMSVLVPQVVDAVKIPVIAAGGIADGRGVAAAFMLGAQGVQLGTRFLASTECNIHETYQKLVLSAKDTDSIVTGRFTGHPCRGIKTKFSRGLLKFEQNGGTPEEFERMTVGALRKAVQDGNVAEGSFLCGAIAGMIHEVKPCKEIVEEIFAQAQQLLGSTAVGREVEA